MLQQTIVRLDGLAAAAPVVVCNDAHRFLVAEQLRQLSIEPRATILEPFGRNTAPAIALAACAALRGVAAQANAIDPVLLVLPADHVIRDIPAFHAAVRAALPAAQSGLLATFGIVANAAETGYGYIQRGAADGPVYRIARFVEKPDQQRAAEFVSSGEYYWNSGCSYFARAVTCRSSSASLRRWRVSVKQHSSVPRLIWTSPASTPRFSRLARPTRSTMQ